MKQPADDHPAQIALTDARRAHILLLLQSFYQEAFDRELSAFQAEQLLEFFTRHLGPPLYNQAMADARHFVQSALDDLDAEYYWPEKRD
jgi:uncharacterized protein (DUF2164 family)